MITNDLYYHFLGCKWVDDVLIDAPYVITRDLIKSLKINIVVTGSSRYIHNNNNSIDGTADIYRSSSNSGGGVGKVSNNDLTEIFIVPEAISSIEINNRTYNESTTSTVNESSIILNESTSKQDESTSKQDESSSSSLMIQGYSSTLYHFEESDEGSSYEYSDDESTTDSPILTPVKNHLQNTRITTGNSSSKKAISSTMQSSASKKQMHLEPLSSSSKSLSQPSSTSLYQSSSDYYTTTTIIPSTTTVTTSAIASTSMSGTSILDVNEDNNASSTALYRFEEEEEDYIQQSTVDVYAVPRELGKIHRLLDR